jgi:hypothetical protein
MQNIEQKQVRKTRYLALWGSAPPPVPLLASIGKTYIPITQKEERLRERERTGRYSSVAVLARRVGGGEVNFNVRKKYMFFFSRF